MVYDIYNQSVFLEVYKFTFNVPDLLELASLNLLSF